MSKVRYPPLKTILLDMDGVIWRGYEPVIDIQALFDKIQQLECQAFCVTNNSTTTVGGYLERLSNFGVNLSSDQIITSAEATASYLEEHSKKGSPIYVIGEEGLKETISNHGFKISDQPETDQAGAVVVGLDFNITYKKIYLAANRIRDGALFIGTNPDKTFPMAGGIAPGAGSIISAVESASGSSPVIIGKPEKYLYQLALTRSGSLPEEALMLGDRLETDIQGAQRLGIRTGLVLTGIASLEDAENFLPGPDLISETALELLENL
jgi:4-nitrophenyl phosphatase